MNHLELFLYDLEKIKIKFFFSLVDNGVLWWLYAFLFVSKVLLFYCCKYTIHVKYTGICVNGNHSTNQLEYNGAKVS